jgi:hypothetical protein
VSTQKTSNKDWPSIKNGPKSTPVKYDPHMGVFVPYVKKAQNKPTKNPKSHYNA